MYNLCIKIEGGLEMDNLIKGLSGSITVYLDGELKMKLIVESDKKGIPITKLITRILRGYFDNKSDTPPSTTSITL